MGHSRLGWLPQTYRWQDIIALIAGGGSADAIADSTLDAAHEGLEMAVRDRGLRQVFLLLAQVVQAARQDNFAMALNGLGLPVPGGPSTFDLVGSFTDAIDDRLAIVGGRTDLSEMAEMAAAESLAALVTGRSERLFDAGATAVREAVRELSTRNGFASLAHEFFARFTKRFLVYHLSRELSCHVGRGTRFSDVHAHGRFLEQIDYSCKEAALVVRDFAGDWYSKANFEGNLTVAGMGKFIPVAVRKLRSELKRRGGRHAAA